jgi:hypothetical protein
MAEELEQAETVNDTPDGKALAILRLGLPERLRPTSPAGRYRSLLSQRCTGWRMLLGLCVTMGVRAQKRG